MRIRPIKKTDISAIDEIYRAHYEDDFSLPSLQNTLTSAVIDNGGEVIGYGQVKLLAEAIMALDLKVSKVDRLRAMQMLMDEALRACNEQGVEQLHVFVKHAAMVRLLERKYGFKIVEDTVMVLGV